MARFTVMGGGSWGTAFSMVLADAGQDVRLWARRPEVCDAINTKHENTDYLPGVAAARFGHRRPATPRGAGRRRVRRAGGAVADAAVEPRRVA